jgi:L-asparagine oxygenase
MAAPDRSLRMQLSLEPGEAELLARGAGQSVGFDLVKDPEGFVSEAQRLVSCLPGRLADRLRALRRHGSTAGGLLISGLPVFDVPPTPARPQLAVGPTLDAAGLLGIISAVLGDQIGFRPELGGQIIQDIVPVAGQERTQQSVSSSEELYTHTELAFADDDYRADYLALFCLRADHEGIAATTLSSVETVLPLLASSTVQILSQPRFRTKVDRSFLRGIGRDTPIWIGPIRALTLDTARPRVRADFAETAGTDPAAELALRELREVAERTAIEVRLHPGDLLVIENNHAFHGRTPFRARWDGLDRWLLRTSIVGYLARSAAHRPGDTRVVDVDYSSLSTRLRHAQPTHKGATR